MSLAVAEDETFDYVAKRPMFPFGSKSQQRLHFWRHSQIERRCLAKCHGLHLFIMSLHCIDTNSCG